MQRLREKEDEKRREIECECQCPWKHPLLVRDSECTSSILEFPLSSPCLCKSRSLDIFRASSLEYFAGKESFCSAEHYLTDEGHFSSPSSCVTWNVKRLKQEPLKCLSCHSLSLTKEFCCCRVSTVTQSFSQFSL